MIYFDARFAETFGPNTVCIRKVLAPQNQSMIHTYAYEIGTPGHKRRGTVQHEGNEDFRLVAAVLNDYVRQYGGGTP